eukprot:5283175-Prymnesium_polylepis.1
MSVRNDGRARPPPQANTPTQPHPGRSSFSRKAAPKKSLPLSHCSRETPAPPPPPPPPQAAGLS